MIELASASAEDRRELFRRAGSNGVGPSDPMMIEKDYWVCWVLNRLFGSLDSDELVPGLVFKGGTSLSKVYGAIHRFSEDIDLTIPRVAAGIEAEADLALGMPSAQAERRLEAMSRRCEFVVSSSIRTDLANRISEGLAAAARDEQWSLEVAAEDASTLIYSYPPALTAGEYGADDYVRPSIRLEFGLKNDPWPAHVASVTPYVAPSLPREIAAAESRVRVLDGARTFWEKATILHLEAQRTGGVRAMNRLSRHYSDLAALADHQIGNDALADFGLLRSVAAHKAMYFRTSWARYDEAAAGNIRLVPAAPARSALAADYARMRDMFFTSPPKFDAVIDRLSALENEIHRRFGL